MVTIRVQRVTGVLPQITECIQTQIMGQNRDPERKSMIQILGVTMEIIIKSWFFKSVICLKFGLMTFL